MIASYYDSLLEALNKDFRAISSVLASGVMMTNLALEPSKFEAPSACSTQMGISGARFIDVTASEVFGSGGGSSSSASRMSYSSYVNSAMKSAIACPLMDALGL